MKTSIYVTSQFAGFHCWPDAPDAVAFLRNLHRHLFKVKVTLPVSHSDRNLEFFICKSKLEKIIAEVVMPVLAREVSLSCEMLAELIGVTWNSREGFYPIEVEVSEDGENGATVNFKG